MGGNNLPYGLFVYPNNTILSVADINVVTVVACSFCPNPHIGDVLVLCIAVQSALDISFEVYTVCVCADRVIPTVHRRVAQYESFVHGIAPCIGDPVVDIEGSRLFRRFRLG